MMTPTAKSSAEWHEQAKRLKPSGNVFIGGRQAPALSGKTFSSINPSNGAAIIEVAEGDQADVDAAVRSARQAFESGVWSRTSPYDRRKVLLRFAQLIEAKSEELALLDTLDMGKPIAESLGVDVPKCVKTLVWTAEAIDKLYDEVAPLAPEDLAIIRREPLGVVAAIVPWNYPLLMAMWKVAPALAAGNCVVLKPAEQSPLSAIRLAEIAMEAGIPEGVLNVVPGHGETAGRALALHMDVDALTFTGSTSVGKLLMQYSGQSNMKRVFLECGGKSPQVVMEDCDNLDAAAEAVAMGIFYNQGEVCNAGSRLIVHERIKDAFLDKVVKASEIMVPADPLDPKTRLGAIVCAAQYDRVLSYIRIGREEGATLRLGGTKALESTGGYFINPTIFDGVQSKMRIAQEEIFGPVLSTLTFSTVDEAMKLANDSVYGLAAGIWTPNINRALSAAQRIRAGVIWVNCFDKGDLSVPFGGFKQTGHGRDKSLHSIQKYTDLKSTWIQIDGV